ncbi:MAG: tRNA (guanosine(46)-N7)-methyltransferase TrmB [Alphaproteobacteria bacterium]|nr:tRNA (guanosine(46)-N7)-methyltransferase TrmB [Alphaproteobacteria bacterium]
MTENTAHHRPIVTYGRRLGRPLKDPQQLLLEEALPRYRFDASEIGKQPLWLEIGFGGGEHLHGVAKANPHALCIGCEPYINGVVSLLQHLKREPLPNVRVVGEDVRPLLESLPDASLDKVFILFPDPWPKVRHHKRRIIGPETLGILQRVMKPGAVLEVATDDMDYAEWILAHVTAHPAFDWRVSSKKDWENPPLGWVQTRYEAKALAQGKRPFYYVFWRKKTL